MKTILIPLVLALAAAAIAPFCVPGTETKGFAVGDELVVRVNDTQLLKPPGGEDDNDAEPLTLFIESRAMGLAPSVTNPHEKLLHFRLERTPGNERHWRELMKRSEDPGEVFALTVGRASKPEEAEAALVYDDDQKAAAKEAEDLAATARDAAAKSAAAKAAADHTGTTTTESAAKATADKEAAETASITAKAVADETAASERAFAEKRKISHGDKSHRLHLKTYTHPGWYSLAAALVIFALATVVMQGATTGMLRDLEAWDENGVPYHPYSLGRVQMAWWFLVILGSYLYVWIILGNWKDLNPTALTLLGISVVTGVFSRSVDATRKDSLELGQPAAGQAAADQAVVGQPAADQSVADQPVADQAVVGQATADQAAANQSLVGQPVADQKPKPQFLLSSKRKQDAKAWRFLTDILSDKSGVSLPRLQMLVWTLVLGCVFLVELWKYKEMPTFGDPLLYLMGISSGVYLGFKFPENKEADKAQQAASQPEGG
ncbi:hypothetical protein [Luteolibacter sp. Populi]|uniref:hypothetical protein n=1 Tax=Luteolibacter sp. Populi TaxID=3230487 RepID=UPI003467B5C2